jgi:1,3-beta-glucan synthase
MIIATLAEFSYTATTWNNTSHFTRRLLFLLVTLALTAGPTFYITIVENQPNGGGSLALILGIAQFFISIGATLLFRIMPSIGCLATGSRASRASTSRLKPSRPVIPSSFSSAPGERLFMASRIRLQVHEIVLFPNPCFLRSNPIQAMAGMKIQNCHEKLFGDSLMLRHNTSLYHC